MHNNNELTGQQTKFSKWLNDTFHEGKHATNAPIDFQGKHFGGGYHRELSKGHDILCFVDGIKMFKEGKFEAIRYENGVAKVFATDTIGVYNMIETGWGPAEGFDVPALYKATTPLIIRATVAGEYTATLKLVKASDRSVVASKEVSVVVE